MSCGAWRGNYNPGAVRRLLIAAAIFGMAYPAGAQWLNYPAPGVPRTKNGAVNMAAPTPRANGRPDLSGIWEAEDNRPCPAGGCLDMKVGQEFVDIGWSLKGGLPYQPWAADARKARMDENGKDDTSTHCLTRGVVKSNTSHM